MDRPQTQSSEKEPPASGKTGWDAVSLWLERAFPWHLVGMLVGNALLSIANALIGGRWWAFWPLLGSGLVLAVHFLLFKTVAVDERWAEERVEELNLKSYDRGHIENLKERYGSKSTPGRDHTR